MKIKIKIILKATRQKMFPGKKVKCLRAGKRKHNVFQLKTQNGQTRASHSEKNLKHFSTLDMVAYT